MTDQDTRCDSILHLTSPEDSISYDDALFLQKYINSLRNEIASIQNPNSNLQNTENLLLNNNDIQLEDVPHVTTLNTNEENHNEGTNHNNSNSGNSNDDSKQINDISYNILITLPSIAFCFEDVLTTYILSLKSMLIINIIYAIAISGIHGVLTYWIFFCKDQKRRKSLIGALFSGFTSVGRIIGDILLIELVNKDELIQSVYHSLTTFGCYVIIVVPIFCYQTNCCRNIRNVAMPANT